MSEAEETYLGDGLYASFDGFQFCLRAPREGREYHSTIFLEPVVLRAFMQFVEKSIKCRPTT